MDDDPLPCGSSSEKQIIVQSTFANSILENNKPLPKLPKIKKKCRKNQESAVLIETCNREEWKPETE